MDRNAQKLTKTLGGGTLEQVVNGSADNNPLAAGVDSESTNLNAVTASNVLDERGLANNFHKLLTSIAVLVEVADVTRGHLLLQRNANGVLDKIQLRNRNNWKLKRNIREYPETKQQREE